jgi:hypothetical protein
VDINRNHFLLRLAFTALLSFPAAIPAAAQCAMCKTTAESDGGLAAGLNLGIIVLLIPPVAIFCAIFRAAYKAQGPSREREHD